ncbi:isoleucyl-tRNA synthetase, putative [Babesia ovata]|uniref:Isoleucyl-tRNA synthetase, putative n=1 Tax=Babesia ovata TaxID=189622 RepID=A0A2H6KHW7_9APIC|nr:isoleucyl-tRNA synthetase, putative [Babesia ovata]GBE62592.1 isoleucyl-tRNA synthetase, putative [Babesia ovata]
MSIDRKIIRAVPNFVSNSFGQLVKARYATTAAHQASLAWKMPWQQCSIFETKRDAGSPSKPRGAQGELGNKAVRASPTQSNPSDHDEHQYIHEIFRKQALPKWNANVYVKALQNFAYLQPRENDNAADLVGKLVRVLAQNINALNNYEITRVIFACSKGRLLQNRYITRSFVRLLENEVMQRLDTLYAIDLFRILHSVTHINADAARCPVEPIYNFAQPNEMPFDPSMVKHVIGRIVDRIANLGTMDIANLTCLIAYNGMDDDKISQRLNSAIRRRLWGIKDTIKVLTPVIALAMFGNLSTDTVNCALKAIRSISTLPTYGVKDTTAKDNWRILQTVNNELYPLKLLEMAVRADYEQVGDSSNEI